MQITLKQTDIEKSLKEYITTQGIRVEGKQVEIVFTAGRRGTGVTAEISIEDMKDVPMTTKAFTANMASEAAPVDLTLPMPILAEPETVLVESANDPEPVPVKTTSLFG